ncbi:hypothetical protein [Lysinibacillus sp. FSL P2-0066]|uniref:hypothetical protein n=1 Tax=Lysinibacillus sp. FSL P2-0066 TaxID=2921720 RepID=UPI0030D74FCE
MIEEKTISKIFCSKEVTKLENSPLLRNDEHLFTFSPFIGTEMYYKQPSFAYGYKIQECFRDVYPNNLINPTAIPFQTLVSLHSFEKIDNSSIIYNFIRYYLINEKNLNKEKIFIVLPEIIEIQNLFKDFKNKIIVPQDNFRCKLPLEGEHFYIKVAYHYLNGFISLANFVIVNISNKSFQLDSVIFPERINMIFESKKYLYLQNKYQFILNEVLKLGITDPEIQHFLIGNLIASVKLLSITNNISSKKHGSTIRRLLKKVYFECNIQNITLSSNIGNIIDSIIQHLEIQNASPIKEIILYDYNNFLLSYSKYQKKIENKLNSIKVLNDNAIEKLYSTYGVDKRVIISLAQNKGIKVIDNNEEDDLQLTYNFDISKNRFNKPL